MNAPDYIQPFLPLNQPDTATFCGQNIQTLDHMVATNLSKGARSFYFATPF